MTIRFELSVKSYSERDLYHENRSFVSKNQNFHEICHTFHQNCQFSLVTFCSLKCIDSKSETTVGDDFLFSRGKKFFEEKVIEELS